jgi:hypothetical protein
VSDPLEAGVPLDVRLNRRVRIEAGGCPCCYSDLLLIEQRVGVAEPLA